MKDPIERQDAINAMSVINDGICEQQAIDALWELPPAEEMALNEWCTDCKEYDHEKGCCPRFNRVIRETVEEVKEAHEEKQGHWIENGYGNGEIVCSNCGEPCATFSMLKPRDRFCKWCGARMEEERR